MKLFYRTQRDLAKAINDLVDAYWLDIVTEEELISSVKSMYLNNEDKFMKDGTFTKIIQQQCGKRRLLLIKKIVGTNE
ncbi:TIGR04540 family protein [Lysinibacillus sp. Ag94]|uniref:TIGR04540 family protein n=1 Tax=Lysinibacillus sp. Ag94 TaxID=2936682 RepID=UPI00200EFE3E|nr:TIGR04540 family protein [Lysinibacillus sp. Ag94]UPW85449.1 TIGR04540 family protein [Lysinibacillus sp. Ag94]